MNWRHQLAHRITDLVTLRKYVTLTDTQERDLQAATKVFPMAITPYYASLMDRSNSECPIRMQSIPSGQELRVTAEEMEDPLSEELDSPVPCLTHRYPDRVLLFVTNQCFVFCRHCNRRRKVGGCGLSVGEHVMEKAFDYIAKTEVIRDVLISGGDPLFLSDSVLDGILKRLRRIPHVRTLRIGTRAPVVLPMRITKTLVSVLRRYHPLFINTHFNHPAEVTKSSRVALARLVDAGIPVGNQTVLLRGINDCPLILQRLFLELIENRVKPYYLFQCDPARGISHFRTPVSRGIEIMESLIGHLPGYAVPTYALDPPGGAGKIPLLPNYLLSMSPGSLVLRNYEGMITRYDEAMMPDIACPSGCTYCSERRTDGSRRSAGEGVAAVLDRRRIGSWTLGIPDRLTRR